MKLKGYFLILSLLSKLHLPEKISLNGTTPEHLSKWTSRRSISGKNVAQFLSFLSVKGSCRYSRDSTERAPNDSVIVNTCPEKMTLNDLEWPFYFTLTYGSVPPCLSPTL